MERLKYGKGHSLWNPKRAAGLYKGHDLSGYTMWVKRTQRDYLEKGPWQRQTQEEMKDSYLVFSYIRGICVKTMGGKIKKIKNTQINSQSYINRQRIMNPQ